MKGGSGVFDGDQRAPTTSSCHFSASFLMKTKGRGEMKGVDCNGGGVGCEFQLQQGGTRVVLVVE